MIVANVSGKANTSILLGIMSANRGGEGEGLSNPCPLKVTNHSECCVWIEDIYTRIFCYATCLLRLADLESFRYAFPQSDACYVNIKVRDIYKPTFFF